MALKYADRVKETTTTTGTGTVNLGGAATGYQTFVAGIATTNTCYYTIQDQSGANWEVGLGTVTAGTPDTLSRTTILASSNSGSAVSFAAGTKDVFCSVPAERLAYIYDNGALGVQVINTSGSVVDNITLGGSATGNPATVTVGSAGSDANININVVPKGTGSLQVSGVAFKMNTTELDFGATPLRVKSFTVTDAAVASTNNIVMQQSLAAPTSKSQDENEFDNFEVRCVAGSGSFTAFVECISGPVINKFKFAYIIG